MLIRSLCDYYDIQSARGEAASDIMSEQPVHWMVMLTPDGRVADIIDKRIEESVPQKNGKVKKACAFKSHILTKKETKRTRRLRQGSYADKTNVKAIKELIPYK